MDNYEQKYKNALSWMQSLYKGLHGKTKEEAETYFPELAESEDERIRKALVMAINNICNGDKGLVTFNGFPKEQVLAWLEKQGEQKPAWSKEDVVMFDKLLTVVKLYYDLSDNDVDKQICISFLKSLKDRVQPQPKQEWSEEDEKKRKRIMHRLSIDGTINNKDLADINDWLKSLRPQNIWKPSDEQMETLWSATEKYLESDNENVRKLRGEVLESLYEDLKNLRKK